MTTIKNMFALAHDLWDQDKPKDSVNVLLKILEENPADKKIHLEAYLLLGAVYWDLKENEKSLDNYKKAADIDPKSEIASQGQYITYVKLGRDEEGIYELFRYLDEHPADLYKTSLEELLEGLKRGFMSDFETQIRDLAKINNVQIER